MPFRRRIAEIERSIEELRRAIAGLRREKADKAKLDKLLGELARARAERLRIIQHQLQVSK